MKEGKLPVCQNVKRIRKFWIDRAENKGHFLSLGQEDEEEIKTDNSEFAKGAWLNGYD